MRPIQKISFVVNGGKPGAEHLVKNLASSAKKAGVETTIIEDYPLPEDALRGADACCVIGGDGTLLGVVAEAIKHDVYVLGVNLGKLGFLATFSPQGAVSHFARFLKGEYSLSERSLLQCITGEGEESLALNDLVIKNRHSSLIYLDVLADGRRVTEYACDGLILSTPTGSTAYNLSANGPIVHPECGVIAMTPICPHTLSNRTVIFPAQTELTIHCLSNPSKADLTRDGRPAGAGEGIFPLKINQAKPTLSLMTEPNGSYFSVLRNKLRWGEGIDE